jgi:hypothetical protein
MANNDLSSIFKSDTKKYQGIDNSNEYFTQFVTEKNQNIYSPADGVVSSVKNLNQGYVVKIKLEFDKEEIETKFQYLSSINVSSGSKIKKGDKIGTSGSNVLRLFIYKEGKTQNPDNWFRRRPEQLTDKMDDDLKQKDKSDNEKGDSGYNSKYLDREKRKEKLKDAFGIADVIGLPFSLVGKGIKSMQDDAKKAKEDIRKKKEQSKNKKEEETDLSSDIQFENYKKTISEEVERIKKLMK